MGRGAYFQKAPRSLHDTKAQWRAGGKVAKRGLEFLVFGKWGEVGGPADAPQTHPLGSDSIGHLRPHPQTVAAKQAVKTCRDVRCNKLLGFKEEFGEVTFLIYAQIHGHVFPSSSTSPPNKRVLPYFQSVQHIRGQLCQ